MLFSLFRSLFQLVVLFFCYSNQRSALALAFPASAPSSAPFPAAPADPPPNSFCLYAWTVDTNCLSSLLSFCTPDLRLPFLASPPVASAATKRVSSPSPSSSTPPRPRELLLESDCCGGLRPGLSLPDAEAGVLFSLRWWRAAAALPSFPTLMAPVLVRRPGPSSAPPALFRCRFSSRDRKSVV